MSEPTDPQVEGDTTGATGGDMRTPGAAGTGRQGEGNDDFENAASAIPSTAPPYRTPKPKYGGLLMQDGGKYLIPFTGRSPNPTAYALRPNDAKAKRALEDKVEKGIGIILTPNDKNLTPWLKQLKKYSGKLGLDGETSIDFGGNTYNLLDPNVKIEYDAVSLMVKHKEAMGDYDSYSIENRMLLCTLLEHSISTELMNMLELYDGVEDNGTLMLSAIIDRMLPGTEAQARAIITKFEKETLDKYAGDNIASWSAAAKKQLDDVNRIAPHMMPPDVVDQLYDTAIKADVKEWQIWLISEAKDYKGHEKKIQVVNGQVVEVAANPGDWKGFLASMMSKYNLIVAKGEWTAKAKPLEQEEAKLSGLVAQMNDKIGKLESTIGKINSNGKPNGGGGQNRPTETPRGGGKKKGKCLICGEDGHYANDCQKGTHPKHPPENGGPEIIKIGDVTWKYCGKCQRWYKGGKPVAHTTAEHRSKEKPKDEQGNFGAMGSGSSVVGEGEYAQHPDDDLLEQE